MSSFDKFLIRMPDGTMKQENPLTGRKAWSVPGRASRPMTNAPPGDAKKIETREPEDYCNFCEKNYVKTPPEKSRLVPVGSGHGMRHRVPPRELGETTAVFRRVPNLFEIVTIDYWKQNHDYRLDPANAAWKEAYVGTREGRRHVLDMIETKLRLLGRSEDEIGSTSEERKLELADAFFGGSHELVVADKHYRENAEWDSDLCSSGWLAQERHFQYFKFTIEAVDSIYAANRYVRYVAVFQNWLRAGGASFDHLHKQLVGIDEWGVAIERELEGIRKNPHIYNMVVNYAGYSNRIVAENEHAVAYVDIGHRFPTLAVYSKSRNLRPSEHDEDEVRGFSDIVHAIHAALGGRISCNEEWFYTPRDCMDRMPWHVYIKLRINTPAGFEGGTRLHINPFSPFEHRDAIVARLYKIRHKRIVDGFKIAEECPCEPNSLRYFG